MRAVLTIAVIGSLMTLAGAASACGNHDASAPVIVPATTADATKVPMTEIPTGTSTKTTKPSG